MNYLPPEKQVELQRERIKHEMAGIRLEEEALKGRSLPEKFLAALGEWMVVRGQKLRKHRSARRVNYPELTKKAA